MMASTVQPPARRRVDRPRRQDRALASFVKLLRAARWVSHRASRRREEAGLTEGQFGVLEALYHIGPLVQKDLAAKLLTSASNLTTVIDNLERDGFVSRRRSEEDRRCLVVDLTPGGERMIEELFPRHAERVEEVMAGLSAAEQRELGDLCRKLGRHAEALD